MSKTIKIVIAEDHQTVREGIRLLIEAQPDLEVIGEAGDGEDAIALVKQLLPDLLLMDISMPRMNGLQATKKLRAMLPDLRILVLTRHTDDGYLRQLIAAGANGYVLKQSAPDQLISAIRTVTQGEAFLDSSLTQRVLGRYADDSLPLRGEKKGDLSSREEEVLRMIAQGHSNKEVAVRLDLSVKTVEAHKANGMHKLGFASRIDLVRFAVIQGWLADE